MKLLHIIFLLFCFSHIMLGQSSNLELTVTDQSSATVPNVTVRLKKDGKITKETNNLEARKFIISNVKSGLYVLEIEASGFKIFAEEIELNSGNTSRTIQLEIAEIVESVVVDQSKQDKNLDPRDGAFTNFLTKAEIDSLPEDPELLKQALQQKFGEDAEFFVDGFSSGGLPRKSAIASIKVSQSSFDAEYHKIGIAIIEITTKPANSYFGSLGLGFNDASTNARPPFSLIRYPEQKRSFDLILWGPIKKNKTSFFLALADNNSFDTRTLTARLPSGNFINSERSPLNTFYFDGKISHSLSTFQTINLAYSYNRNDSRNLGIGGFELPERAFDLRSRENQIRYSQVGNVGKRFYNEFRFQYGNGVSTTTPANDERAIIVLGSFTRGGAGNFNQSQKQNILFTDNFLFGIKNHALKIGGLFEYESANLSSAENDNGTFTFSSLNDFLLNRPSIFSETSGIRKIKFSLLQFGTFIQDDIRVSKGLLLSFGFRYELQNNINDHNNFSPRIGFSWSPKEDGKTTFRGGIAIFYNWFESSSLAAILSQDESQIAETVIINPGFPDPYTGGISQILPRSFRKQALNLRNPYVFLTQFGVQRQLSEKISLRVQYSYQKTIHQFRTRDLNAPINFIRPNANLGRILLFESSAFSIANSLKLDLTMSPTKRTYLSFNYRLAKNISDSNSYLESASDSNNLRLDRSVTNNDQRHNINATLGWTLPKGFRFSMIARVNSPRPYTITTGMDNNGDTIFNDRPIGVAKNSERGIWINQFDTSLSWQVNLESKNGGASTAADPNTDVMRGKTLKLTINAANILNQTIITNFAGVQTSPFFRQPIAASNSRKIDFGARFSF